MATKEEIEAVNNFREATRGLKKVNSDMQENVGLRTILAKRDAGLQKLEGIIIGNGIRKDILDFVRLKKQQRQLRKESGLTRAEFRAQKLAEKKRKKELNKAKANDARRKARDAALKETLGEEQAAIQIQALNARDNAQIIADAQVQAEASKAQDDKEAADAAKKKAEEEALAAKEEGQINSLTEAANSIMEAFTDSDIAASFQSFADSLQTVISASGVEDSVAGQELVAEQIEMLRMEQREAGESPAERDKAKAEAKEASNKQLDLLQKIADNISSGGAGGGGGDEGSSPFGKAMKGALSGLGKGIGALGKGIGVFLKMVGSGAGKLIVSLAKGFAALGKALGPIGKGLGKAITFLLKGLAKGVKAFINPAVIGGLAVFTLGMIGLGAALRLAAPAFEALAPIIIKMADVIGNVLMTAIKEIPEIFRSIGYVIESVGITITAIIDAIGGAIESVGKGFLMVGESVKRVLNGIASVVKAIGDSITGVIGSIGSSIAEVVNAVRGDARAEAEAQIAVLEAQTLSIQKLSRLDPGTMTATAAGIESIKNALAGLGSPSLMGAIGKFLGDDGPIGELLELAKNAQGITDASNALVKFVENAKLFEEGIEIDDSVIKGIQRVVKALGSGNPQALGSFSNAVNAINNIDEKKIGLLSKINIPQVMPPTAAEYERIFKALQTAEPSTIEKVQGFFSKVFSRPQRSQRPQRGSALESMRQRQSVDAAGASGGQIDKLKALIADPNTTNTDRTRAKKKLRRLQQAEAAGFSRENVTAAGGSMSSMSSINAAANDVAGSPTASNDVAGSPTASNDPPAATDRRSRLIAKLEAEIANPNTKSSARKRARKKLAMQRKAQSAGMTRENMIAAGGSMSASSRRGELVSASPPAAAAASGGGGNVSISAPTTNSNQSTSSYPITNRPNDPALDRLRMSLEV